MLQVRNRWPLLLVIEKLTYSQSVRLTVIKPVKRAKYVNTDGACKLSSKNKNCLERKKIFSGET